MAPPPPHPDELRSIEARLDTPVQAELPQRESAESADVRSESESESEQIEPEPEIHLQPDPAPEPTRAVPSKRRPLAAGIHQASTEMPKERKRQREKIQTKQEVLQFEPITRGRFEKSEPTIVEGQDLDVPTYLRKNVRVK
jgi:cell division protein FtsZ